MNKLLVIAAAFIFSFPARGQDEDKFIYPTGADYPDVSKTGRKASDFIPSGYRVVEETSGDLNDDRAPDSALVVIGQSKKFLNRNKGLGGDVYDTNPRVLLILFRVGAGYRLAAQSNTFIIAPPSPVNSEPLQSIAIKKGLLNINLELWQSAGGWGMTNANYKFKYTGGDFVLIGAERTDAMRNSGETETYSYNFLTRRVSISKGSFSDDGRGKVRWKTLGKIKLRTLKTLPVPFEWDVQQGLQL